MLVSRDQNVSQNRDIDIGNRLFENVSQFKYLRMRVTIKNLIQEEIKRRLKSGNACYHSGRTFCLLVCFQVNLEFGYKKLILSVDLYGCETWSLTLRE
jgi:hypothetical protein